MRTSRSRLTRRFSAFAVGTVAAVALSVGLPASSSAAEHDGVCNSYEICLFYNSSYAGAKHDFARNVPDFAPYRYFSPGAGAGQGVKNNAASAYNYDASSTARIYYNSNYAGPADDIRPRSGRQQLGNTYNDNASMRWCFGQTWTCG